jgi:hypothetical protein
MDLIYISARHMDSAGRRWTMTAEVDETLARVLTGGFKRLRFGTLADGQPTLAMIASQQAIRLPPQAYQRLSVFARFTRLEPQPEGVTMGA